MSNSIMSFAKQVGEDIGDILKRFRPSAERVLDADEDLNTVLEKGIYNATFNMVDWEAQNYPGNLKGYVVVETIGTVNQVTQYFYSRSNLSVPYIAYRFKLTSGWSPWVQIQPIPDQFRQDTSVGTRVFVGDTMVHGDTGWRVHNALATGFDFTTSSNHKLTIRRLGDQVFIEVSGTKTSRDPWVTEIIPGGFRMRSGECTALRGTALIKGQIARVGNSSTLHRLNITGTIPDEGDHVVLNATWFTDDPWPSSLPGTPA